MSHLKTAALAALSLALAAPAYGGELEDGVAAINAAAAGAWTGTVNSIDPASGAQTPMAYDFTLVVTSDDGLDFAYWGPDGLTMMDYEGDGAITTRTWSRTGVLAETVGGEIALAETSEPGAKAWTVSSTRTGPDGNAYDIVSTYTVSDGALTYLNEASLAGAADAPKVTLGTGSWTRP